MDEKWILFRLQQIGDPDDGMLTVATGCKIGSGKDVLAVISDKLIVTELSCGEMDACKGRLACNHRTGESRMLKAGDGMPKNWRWF